MVESRPYPGDFATPKQVYALAEAYRVAAIALRENDRRHVLSWAPFRLCAFQAIELYLNALLLHHGFDAATVRGFQHSLTARIEAMQLRAPVLRARTLAHLRMLDQNRELLVTRYGPELAATTSQINRFEATLNEVALKVSRAIGVAARAANART